MDIKELGSAIDQEDASAYLSAVQQSQGGLSWADKQKIKDLLADRHVEITLEARAEFIRALSLDRSEPRMAKVESANVDARSTA